MICKNSNKNHGENQLTKRKKELYDGIVQAHNDFKNENNPILLKWKKVHLMTALGAFHIGWFNLCESSLGLALEPLCNISQESWHLKHLESRASTVDDQTLKEDIYKGIRDIRS